jgi:hypothetical protein
MSIGLLTLYLYIPGCTSLKEKRSRLKPLLARLQREFNLSVAELDRQDAWQEAVVGCAMLSNDGNHVRSSLQTIRRWVETNWSEGQLLDEMIEII